jgi:cytochrome c2
MPRGNGIKLILVIGVLLGYWTSTNAQKYPLVIGYERFHSEEPSVEGGRILFNELGCVQCHEPTTGLPEHKGPDLAGITLRSHPEYISDFLKNPGQKKPGTTMPQMHLKETEVDAVVHYLASLNPNKKIPEAFRFVNAERGLALYHDLGCVACHEPSPKYYPADGKPQKEAFTYPHIPLPDLTKKFDFNSLSAFLYEPHDYWPQGRMPKFKLEKEDGGDLTAFLLNFNNGDSTEYPSIEEFEPKQSLVDIGKVVVQLKNCAVCHNFPESENLESISTISISSNSIQATTHPQYNLSSNQNASIELFLEDEGKTKPPKVSYLQTLNCLSCHDHYGSGGPDPAHKVYFSGNNDLGDSGRYPPPLTNIGKKLQADYLENVLKGKINIRPYLRTQMPEFGESVLGLSEILVLKDQQTPEENLPPKHLEMGRQLLGTVEGLGCISCHNWEERKSLGIQALDLSSISKRLQLEWFENYLINPAAYRPNTLMPSFWPEGVASNQDILHGDSKAQIAAIYNFTEAGEGLPEGFPDQQSGEFEIIPTEYPIIQRTFMNQIGTHAILVGFPEGIHIGFNTLSSQPALMWKGKFFDAYNTWYSRFPKFEKPLGEEVVSWSKGQKNPIAQFKGYRLDKEGIPEFILSMNDDEVYERFTPHVSKKNQLGILRVITYSRLSQLRDKRLTHPKRTRRQELKNNDPMTRSFFYQW